MTINPQKMKRERHTYRGHLPPPFYIGKEDAHRVEYLSEARLSHNGFEDTGNYGTGGYYGNTYRQEPSRRERSDATGNSGDYRQLGDRRWTRSPHEAEDSSRHGYRSMDERIEPSPSQRGKGPRYYQRSDERILEDLNDRLYDDPYLNAADIESVVQDGEVILSGMVEDKQSKRRAEDIAEAVSGVRNVENRLRVLK